MRTLALAAATLFLAGCPKEDGNRPPGSGSPLDTPAPGHSHADSAGGAPGCAPVATLSCGDVARADTADWNSGATDAWDSYADAIGRFDGPELVYALTAPAAVEVELRLRQDEPMEVDQDVFVLAGTCAPASSILHGLTGGTFALEAGETVFLAVDGYRGTAGAFELTVDCTGLEQPAGEPAEEPTGEPAEQPAEAPCLSYDSDETEYAPVQTTGAGLPGGPGTGWTTPTTWTSWVDFEGTPGQKAHHEGVDYIHADGAVAVVDVVAAGAGEVVYVRTGCGQSHVLQRNLDGRECGSGWGNHVVVRHPGGLLTRYAHLAPDDVDVLVGDGVAAGDRIGGMGNSGRSETRHLHFEVGSKDPGFDSCAPTQSFDAVFPPRSLPGVGPD